MAPRKTTKVVKTLSPNVTVGFFGILLALSLGANVGLLLKIQNTSEETTPLVTLQKKEEPIAEVTPETEKEGEKKMSLVLLYDESCKNCADLQSTAEAFIQNFDDVILSLVRLESQKGQELVAQGISVVPALVIDRSFEETPLYEKFVQQNGISPIGKEYFELRTIGNKRILSEMQIPKSDKQIVAFVNYLQPNMSEYVKNNITPLDADIRPFANDISSSLAIEAILCGFLPQDIEEKREVFFQAAETELQKPENKDLPEEEFLKIVRGIFAEIFSENPSVACFENGDRTEEVGKRITEAQVLGITGTPAFFIGDRFLAGEQKKEDLEAVIEEVFGKKEVSLDEKETEPLK